MADDDKKPPVPKAITPRTARAAASHAEEAASDTVDEVEDELEDHLTSLREQLAELRQQVEDFAEDHFSDAREMVSTVADAGTDLARRASHQTARAARAVRNDPLPLVVALGVVALLTAVFVVRSSEDEHRHHRWM